MTTEPLGFGMAKRRAKRIMKRKSRLRRLLSLATLKTVASKDGLKEAWNDLTTFIRLVTAWMAGTYTKIPYKSIFLMVAAIVYFVNPIDLIPDFLMLWGLIDDALVLSFVAKSIKDDLDAFRQWERAERLGVGKAEAAIIDKEEPQSP